MFAALAFTVLLTSSSFLLGHAIVTPNEPGGGESFNTGTTCHIGWAGDTVSTTAWKDMAIELMSGSNLNMNHITTVATGQDGTVAGTFDYTCPDVTPNAPIYFYQFTSPHTPNVTWTTRFTIAAADGSSVPAPNATQPNGDPIPWGVGALVDPSTAVPPPNVSNTTTSASAVGATTSPSLNSTTPLQTSTPNTLKTVATSQSRAATSASSAPSPTHSNAAASCVIPALFGGSIAALFVML